MLATFRRHPAHAHPADPQKLRALVGAGGLALVVTLEIIVGLVTRA